MAAAESMAISDAPHSPASLDPELTGDMDGTLDMPPPQKEEEGDSPKSGGGVFGIFSTTGFFYQSRTVTVGERMKAARQFVAAVKPPWTTTAAAEEEDNDKKGRWVNGAWVDAKGVPVLDPDDPPTSPKSPTRPPVSSEVSKPSLFDRVKGAFTSGGEAKSEGAVAEPDQEGGKTTVVEEADKPPLLERVKSVFARAPTDMKGNDSSSERRKEKQEPQLNMMDKMHLASSEMVVKMAFPVPPREQTESLLLAHSNLLYITTSTGLKLPALHLEKRSSSHTILYRWCSVSSSLVTHTLTLTLT